MSRNLFTAFSTALSLLSIALVVLWVRSSTTQDSWEWGTQRQSCSITSSEGVVLFWREAPTRLLRDGRGLHHTTTDASAITFSDWVEMKIERNWFWHGFGLMMSHEDAGDLPEKCVAVAVPHWFFVVLLAVLPAGWLASISRKSRRLHGTLCCHCGYDVRASTDRCPECGQPIVRHLPGSH